MCMLRRLRKQRRGSLNHVTEAGSFVAHPSQLVIGELQLPGLSSAFHDGLPSHVDSLIGENQDRQRYKPHTYEPQLDPVYGDCQGDCWSASRLRLTSKNVSWVILAPVDVA